MDYVHTSTSTVTSLYVVDVCRVVSCRRGNVVTLVCNACQATDCARSVGRLANDLKVILDVARLTNGYKAFLARTVDLVAAQSDSRLPLGERARCREHARIVQRANSLISHGFCVRANVVTSYRERPYFYWAFSAAMLGDVRGYPYGCHGMVYRSSRTVELWLWCSYL